VISQSKPQQIKPTSVREIKPAQRSHFKLARAAPLHCPTLRPYRSLDAPSYSSHIAASIIKGIDPSTLDF
jgi:hypothetical protein